MSYCRWSDSDVYLFLSPQGIVCCACPITSLRFLVNTGIDPIQHLVLLGRVRLRPWKKKWLAERQRIVKHGGLVDREVVFTSRTAALMHIAAHRTLGEHVPQDVDAHLRDEIESKGDTVRTHSRRARKFSARRRPFRAGACSKPDGDR